MSTQNDVPVLSFQGPCPNCGASDGIISLQARYLSRNESRKSNNIGLEIPGFKLGLTFNEYNPDARFLSRKQGPISSFLEQLTAYFIFMSGLILFMFGIFYGFAIIIKYAKVGILLSFWPLLALPLGVLGLFFGNRSSFLSRKRETEYWNAFAAMATVPCCKCGYTASPLPKELS